MQRNECEANKPKLLVDIPCYQNGYTAIPNFFFDEMMPRVAAEDLKVLLFIWRKTWGWQKRRDFISLTQIQQGARVCRHKALSGVRLWESVGLLRRTGRSGIRGIVEYEIVLDCVPKVLTSALDALVSPMNRCSGRNATSASEASPPVSQTHTQNKTIKRNQEKEPPIRLPNNRETQNSTTVTESLLVRENRTQAEELWGRILQLLKNKGNPQTYHTWFQPTNGISSDGQVLVVSAPNTMFTHWLENDGARYVGKVLDEISPGLKVRYVTQGT